MSSIVGDTVRQQHSGPGDNIARDKIVNQYQSIAPDALQKPIELILSAIRGKNPDLAKDRLEIIKATSTLDTSSEIILDGLSLHLNLLEDKEKTKLFSSLITFLKTPHNDLTRDLCLATLIRLEAESDRIDDARERYFQISQPGPYSQEVFYELVATTDELERAYKKNKINLGESELNGLVRGFFRTENLPLALTVANRLNNVFPSFNSRVLVVIAKGVTLLNGKLQETYFWTITATLKAELIELIEEIVSLINESNGQDKRLFNIALPSLQYMRGEHKELRDICWKYVDQFEASYPEAAALLHNFYTEDSSKIKDSFVHDYVKAKQDKEYRKQLVNELTSSTEIPIDKFLILKDFELNKISQWGKAGGVVIGENDLEADFRNLQLRLLTLSTKKNRIEIESLRAQAEKFINTHQEKLPMLDPFILIELAENLLLHPELSLIVCNLVKPLLSTSDLWASPIVKCYLNALLYSEQTATLDAVLKDIRENEWDSELWIIQSNMLEHLADYPQAIQSIEKALELDRYSLKGWYCLTRLHRKFEDSDEIVRSVLQRIPDKVLLSKSDAVLTLLVEIAQTGDFNQAERIILSWFIENPDACASAISNFHFNLTIGKRDNLVGHERVGDCVVGVVYIEDNVQMTKLLVDIPTPKHHCLLDINSPLGTLLNNMDIGEIKQHGMHDYKLIERLPAYVAAFRISLELRKIQNDGNDSFCVFQIPSDPDEMFAVFEEKLSRIQNKNDRSIINNPDIPITFKGYSFHRNDPVKAALILWSTENSAKYQLPNFGESSPTKVILDVYTIAYLALTGLALGVTKIPVRFIITQETKYFIEEWLKEINREDYLSMGVQPGGGLWRVTAEDIKQSTHHRQIQAAFNLIIDEAEVVTPALVDMPPLILRIHDLVDDSVYSSIKLSISNDIPWLCVDGMLAHLFHTSGWKSVDAFKLFIELGSTLGFEQKKEGLYLHALERIPYALTFQDLDLLSTSSDELAHYFLAKIIYLYPKAFNDTNVATDILSRLVIPVLANAYLEGEILRGLRLNNPRNNGYAERVFNACCYVSTQCDDGIHAELALTMLLCKLFKRFLAIPPMLRLICAMATAFANGHFLSIPLINQHISRLDIN
jgi:tetratricopeptide (TPR) repeat protein